MGTRVIGRTVVVATLTACKRRHEFFIVHDRFSDWVRADAGNPGGESRSHSRHFHPASGGWEAGIF